MRLGTFLKREDISLMEGPAEPESLFRQILGSLDATGIGTIEMTDLGGGFFLPHARRPDIDAPVVKFVRLAQGWAGRPPSPVWCFVLLSPSAQPDFHLRLMSHLAWLAGRPGMGESLSAALDGREVLAVLQKAEAAGMGGFTHLTAPGVFRELQSSPLGLTTDQARERAAVVGPNLLQRQRGEPLWMRLGRNFVSVFALLLWVAGALCFLPGVDMPPLGWAIFSVVVINGVFSFWQEHRAERAVEALQNLIPPLVQVVRNGVSQSLPAADLVWGDVIILEEGDLVPADARLIEASDFRVNLSSLTGESRPLYKTSDPLPRALSDDFLWTELPNLVFAGTSVASGQGRALVTGTGMDTEIGQIAKLTQAVQKELSPLQKEMKTVVNVLTALSLGIGAVFFALGVGVGGLSLTAAFLFTIGITVANIPEGLLPTLSLSLALGVQRLARRKVLVKHLASVETLGSTTVICTDKTGTLTTNRVAVVSVWPRASEQAWLVAQLCNNARSQGAGTSGDSTEVALLNWAETASGLTQESRSLLFPRLAQFPFESVRKRMSTVHRSPEGLFVCAKGAPLELLDRCDRLWDGKGFRPIGPGDRAMVKQTMDEMASRGLRTLALARKDLGSEVSGPDEAESGLDFLALCGMEDPPRPEVAEAIAQCATAGIRLIMITGDYGLTALAIARQIGMVTENSPGRCLSGIEVERLSDADLDRFLTLDRGPLVFSRMAPDQKMRIVSRLKAAREVVAVTGDGVNDAAALKMADIGIAMGADANAVAKESASMVVLDGSFSGIVAAVEEGRAVYANIRRFVTYILASNMPELAPFVLFVLLKIPLALTVMQILAIDLGTDLVPALGLGQEPPEKGLMNRPPRKRSDRLIDRALFVRSYLWLGAWEIVFSMGAYFWALGQGGWSLGQPLPDSGPLYTKATTMTLAAIVFCQIGNVFSCRATVQSVFTSGLLTNRLVLVGVAAELILLAALVYVPFLASVFGLSPLSWGDWVILSVVPFVFLGLEETRKFVVRRREPL